MKKVIFLLLFLCANTFSHAQSIEQTLNQISELKLEIENNESLVNEKIDALKDTNPIFAEQDPFESDAEYLGRMSTAMPALDRIRKEYLGDKWGKMSILRGRMFETSDITVALDVKQYDANTEKWPITITHNAYQQESFPVTLAINKDDARTFHTNWDKVKKTGILTIDVGDRIGLAKIILFDPISGLKFSHEFTPMLEFPGQEPFFSTDGNWLFYYAANRIISKNTSTQNEIKLQIRNSSADDHPQSDGCHTLNVNNDIYVRSDRYLTLGVFKFPSMEIIYVDPKDGFGHVAISPDGKFVARSYKYDRKIRILNLETKKWIMELEAPGSLYNLTFNPGGNLLLISSDREGTIIYNLETQKIKAGIGTFKDGNILLPSNAVKRIIFHPTLNAICYATYSSIIVKSLDRHSLIFQFDYTNNLKKCTGICISPDGKHFAVSGNGATYIYSTPPGSQIPIYTNKTFPIANDIGFSPDNKYLVGTNDEDEVLMFRTMFEVEGDVLEQKSIVAPPNLITNISFSEPSGNNYLDALEKGYFEIEINNTGQGPAKGISITVSPNKTDKLNYNNTYIEEIPAGEITSVKIPIEAYLEVQSGTHDFTFHFEEVNGFSPQDVQIQFSTKEYQLPDFYVVDFQMNEPEISKNGNIDASEIIDLNIRIGNKGIGSGKGVFVKFTLGDNVFITNTPTQVNIGNLEFNETRDIPLSFFVNQDCSEQIPIFIDIADETNLVIVKNQRIELFKSSNIASVKKTVITGIDANTELTIKGLNSLVDNNIPINEKVNNRFALVIGNEDYKSKQSTLSAEQNVDYAINDATIFKKYCLSTFGVKEENMFSIMNATAGEMSQKIDLLTKILSKLDSASELIVYYAGHGYPDELTKVPYLIPVDVSASNLSSAIKLDKLYQDLANTNASKITIFLDACFTGGGRNSGLVASRGIKVKPKQGSLNGNIVVFSASSEDQSSLPYHDEGHGVFTYFLLKKFQETQGNVTLGELSDYLEKNVSIQSLRVNQKEQDPTVNTSQKVVNDWRNWKF
jgi:WD40 repeat protein